MSIRRTQRRTRSDQSTRLSSQMTRLRLRESPRESPDGRPSYPGLGSTASTSATAHDDLGSRIVR